MFSSSSCLILEVKIAIFSMILSTSGSLLLVSKNGATFGKFFIKRALVSSRYAISF